MNKLQEEAKRLRDANDFKGASNIYKKLYDDSADKWDGWGLALCFNKLKKYKEALLLSEKIYQEHPDFNFIKSTYALSLFMERIKQSSSSFDSKNLEKNLNMILHLEEDGRYFSGAAALETVDYFSKNNNWEKVYEISSKIDPNILSIESVKWEGKIFPSDREKWYLKITKACASLEKWIDCMNIAKKGLEDFPDVIWLKRSYALSYGNNGNIKEAIKLLEDLLYQKKDWFMYRDIARMHKKDSNLIEEKKYLIEGCFTSRGVSDPRFRWKMYYDLGCNLLKSGDTEYGKLHIQLAYAAKKEAEWPIGEDLHKIMTKHDIEEQFEKSAKQFIKELSVFWEQQKYKNKKKEVGKIKIILNSGNKEGKIFGSGFIKKAEEDQNYYFTFKDFKYKDRKLIKVGLEVVFYIEKSFDYSKGEKSEKAVNISFK